MRAHAISVSVVGVAASESRPQANLENANLESQVCRADSWRLSQLDGITQRNWHAAPVWHAWRRLAPRS